LKLHELIKLLIDIIQFFFADFKNVTYKIIQWAKMEGRQFQGTMGWPSPSTCFGSKEREIKPIVTAEIGGKGPMVP